MSIADALENLRETQRLYYDGLANKDDLKGALDGLRQARMANAPKPVAHNPPVKLT